MKDCKFCDELKLGEVVIWENEYFFSKFDGNPVSPGHALLITKSHIPNISALNKEEKEDLIDSIESVKKEIEKADLKKVYSSERSNKFTQKALVSLDRNSQISGYNYGINDGDWAGQTVFHLHVHVIPRYEGDVDDPIGGVRNTIPGMGNYKK